MEIRLKIWVVRFQDSQYLNIYLIHKSGEQETDGKKNQRNIRKICPFFFKGKHEFSDQKGYQVLDLWKNQYQSQEKTLVNYKGKEIK